MNLTHKIKSRFKNIEIKKAGNMGESSIEVSFDGGITAVLITEDEHTHRYSACYPALVRDGHGGWKTEEICSQHMLIEGVFWITNEIKRYGKVKPEIMD